MNISGHKINIIIIPKKYSDFCLKVISQHLDLIAFDKTINQVIS